jgi:hypothetical protein
MAGPRGVFKTQILALLPAKTKAEADAAAWAAEGGLAVVESRLRTSEAGIEAVAWTWGIVAHAWSLGDPLADRATAVVITDNPINGDDGRAAGAVADNVGGSVVAGVGFGCGGGCKTKNSGCSDK